MHNLKLKALALLTLSSTSATPVANLDSRQSNPSPCAAISQAYNDYSGNTTFSISAQDAYACLKSMPFRPKLSQQFLDQLLKYIQFHSTLESLKNPPSTYLSKSFDVLGGFETIASNVAASTYASHYDFEAAVDNVMSSANDGHLYVSGLCYKSIFDFSYSQNLVSVSADGVSQPQVYLYSDALLLLDNAASNTTVSPVTTINGQPVVDYLVNLTSQQGFQDPDARYNTAFPNYAVSAGQQSQSSPSGVFSDSGSGYKGDSVAVGYLNGTSATLTPSAYINSKLFNATSGEILFEQYCAQDPSSSSTTSDAADKALDDAAAADDAPPPAFTSGPLGYPTPDVSDPYNEVLGYVLSGRYSDAVVLQIPTFMGEVREAKNETAIVHEYAAGFVQAAVEAGKKKIIIDVSGNGGGQITRGFDLFKLFFPNLFPYSATRFRNHPAATIIGEVGSTLNRTAANQIALAYRGDVTPDQKQGFPTMESVFNGGIELGVNVSNLIANFNFSAPATEPVIIQGFGNTPTTFTTPPFAPEDILIVGDGWCSSTCTTFVNLMTNYGGVKSLAFGGRPNDQPMQLMGGVRGGQSAGFAFIDSLTTLAASYISENPTFLSPERLELAANTLPLGLTAFPFKVKSAAVNFRNAYQEGQPNLPLQFAYQAADCRLYYTVDNVLLPGTQWLSAYDAVWSNGTCVGAGQSSSPAPYPTPSGTATAPIATFTGAGVRECASRWAALGVMGLVVLLNL